MSTMRNCFLVCFFFILVSGCASKTGTIIDGHFPAADTRGSGEMLRAGAASADITPPPGFPMGGHSISGQISRGHWLRLKVRSLYIEARNGSRIALVAIDLWSMPAGLADRVAEINAGHASAQCRLGRGQMVFSATHTHQSPGNFSTSPLYNTFGSKKPGFDRDLFDFLAQRMAGAVRESCESAEEARLYFGTTRVNNLARNRSIGAFLKNPESWQVLSEGEDLQEGDLPDVYTQDKRAYHAVDPTLQTLWMISDKTPSHVIGVGAFTAVHPTALNHEAEVYSSDLFGAASMIAEQKLKSESDAGAPVVAIFNGAEGDVSPAWVTQGRDDVLQLGNILGEAVLKTRSLSYEISGNIRAAYAKEQLAGAHVRVGGKDVVTAKKMAGGPAVFGGAEDGRTDFYDNPYYCREGRSGLFCHVLFRFVRGKMRSLSPPKEALLAIYQLGPIVFATLPGEFTTVMGRRVRHDLVGKFNTTRENIVLLGLTNAYLSYFTTPEEYKAQHYEGGSTMYGGASGTLVGQRLNTLADQLADTVPVSGLNEGEYRYEAGKAETFTPADLDTVGVDALKEKIVETMFPGADRKPEIHSACWQGPAPAISEAEIYKWETVPSVQIEIKQPDDSWQPFMVDGVPEDDHGRNIITQLSAWKDMQSTWCTFWLPPKELKETGLLRFRVTGHDGAVYKFPEFHLESDH